MRFMKLYRYFCLFRCQIKSIFPTKYADITNVKRILNEHMTIRKDVVHSENAIIQIISCNSCKKYYIRLHGVQIKLFYV